MTNNFLNFHLKIYGKVQGVGFRAWTKKTAEDLFLTGWVKNCEDESVECEVSGKRENIDFFGKPALTTTLPAQLALKYKLSVVPVFIERLDDNNFC